MWCCRRGLAECESGVGEGAPSWQCILVTFSDMTATAGLRCECGKLDGCYSGEALLHCARLRPKCLGAHNSTQQPPPPPAGGRKDREERREVRAELRRLGKEERQRQEKAVAEVLAGAQVVCTTLTGG